MNITQLIEKLDDNKIEPHELASLVADEILSSPNSKRLIEQSVRPLIGVLRRGRVRKVEGVVRDTLPPERGGTGAAARRAKSRATIVGVIPTAPPAQNPLEAWATFNEETFTTPQDGVVLWLDATVQQHQNRIAMLAKDIFGISKTVKLHESAVTEITTAGVRCLRDLEAAA